LLKRHLGEILGVIRKVVQIDVKPHYCSGHLPIYRIVNIKLTYQADA
jgi:hypothetical protein